MVKIFFKKTFSKRGFIGPIGDDLPSLIPIIVALLLFFTIFSLTLNSYNEKNELLNRHISMLTFSRILKEDSLISGIEQFSEGCNVLKLEAPRENMMVAIYPVEVLSQDSGLDIIQDFKDFEESNSLDHSKVLKENNEFFFCNYRKLGGRSLTNMRSNYYMRFYPVAVQTEVVAGDTSYLVILPGMMVMVIWE